MTPFRTGRHPPRNTISLVFGVAAVSVAALVWMGLRLAQQDRALEATQLEEQREAAANRILAGLEQALAEEELRLADPAVGSFHTAAEDVLRITIDPSEVHVQPDTTLLYYPVLPPGREAHPRLYADAEKAEFLDKDHTRAIDALRPLSRANDPAARAGAQLRLARNLRKAGRIEAALETYAELAENTGQGISFSGVPADLVARRARCSLLEELGRREPLRQEAQRIRDDLRGRRWRLERSSYLYYSEQAARWLDNTAGADTGQTALAEAVFWLWQNRNAISSTGQDSAGRRSFQIQDMPITALWRVSGDRLAAIVAGPGYQQSQWFDPLLQRRDFSNVQVSIRNSEKALVYGSEPPTGVPLTSLPSSATGLPWDIALVNADLEADRNQFAQRRRLMLSGLGVLAVFVIAASYLIGRGVSRELAAARLQSDFVSAVSHEFRTPLTSMRQFTEMLVDDEKLTAEKRHEYYRAQERATRRLSRLVESLLDFGRMEAGARPYRLERLDAGRMVSTMVEEFRQEINSPDFVIECTAPDEGPIVNGDKEALTQALWNLLDNAVKYSGDSRSVRVEVEAGDRVAIRVRDQGAGIPESERDRIFRKFVRGSSAKAEGIKGTGIGLAMVEHIVDAHGGKVRLESEPGRGSRFTIELPGGD